MSRIQNLLDRAEKQKESSTSEQSSIACAERRFDDQQAAESHFAGLREKLRRIKRWNHDSLLTSFALHDEKGNESGERAAEVGDFICIFLHGSGKNDWVKITALDDAPNETILTVRPSFNPTEEKKNENVVSHFFTDAATNNFCLQRENEIVRFYVIGLNEISNTVDTKNVLETVRNAATANIGSYLGIQNAQWQTFCDNFLETEWQTNSKQ
jgi:hypothetical protein